MKFRLPFSYYNPISYIGTAVAIIAFFMFGFLYVLSSLSHFDKAYVGVVIFIAVPTFIILGLVLIPIGMILKVRQQKKAGIVSSKSLPTLNLNLPQHRNATIIFTVGTLIFLFLSGLGSYEAYHFTESNRFCGTLCHTLMIPEFTAYQTSPHAKVHCAECHIGAGANWYVKSKLSGLYQVYATLTNSYPRPIPTPIKNLRPARETCEECHWPQKVYGKQQRREIYYLPDENNTRWEINMLMNTGGGNPALGHSSGIHWHINPDIQVEYITTDKERSQIPKVFLIDNSTGNQIVFDSLDEPLDESDNSYSERRVMDCIDCHNRPSHVYRDPSKFINIAMAAGEIDQKIPMIKQTAVEACVTEYQTTESAVDGIAKYITSYYKDNYPEVLQTQAQELEKSIKGVQTAYTENIFPEMAVKWEAYPEHIGHMTNKGCDRCHDGRHASASGQVISNNCDDCHIISAQGPVHNMEFASSESALKFKHPVDIEEAWKEVGCFECHSVPPM